jgi:hypothetical protein
VTITLETKPLDACLPFDANDGVTVNELVQA